MQAIVLNAPDGTDRNMILAEHPEPSPPPGSVVVSVAFGGLNFADLMMRKGIYPHPKGYPLVAGIEMAGIVSEIGEDVSCLAVGDRVVGFCEDAGAFAEKCSVPAARLVRVPEGVDLAEAAACFVQGVTAWHLLHTVSETKPGDVILVHAAGGGVGLYLTQLATLAGATVIGTVGTRGKEARALEYGAARIVNRDDEDFVEAVMDFTRGCGVDKIIDSTGGSILDRSFDAIRKLGHVVSYGEAEGRPFPNLWERLVGRSLTFSRLHIGHIDWRSTAWKEAAAAVFTGVQSGTLVVPIEEIFSLDSAQEMYRRLESRQVSGKLLLKIG